MKINYIYGDLFETEDKMIIHGCNCQGVMGSGVAKIIKTVYPKAYTDYKNAKMVLGRVIWSDTGESMIIGNCLTQEFYGRDKNTVYLDYFALRDCLNKVHNFAKGIGIESVSMPKIGAGFANGDWNVIEKMIEEEFKYVQPNVWVIE